ncbi:hypothetical protein O6H91_03G020400 [Diphasiastrum complanatum]|uniref:Uncharacterized protein n=1 Tax=Diphasiastrum complanatum TaxID=34168 RepID=A0ACC2E419_DIPCM|nr:hypothetical protein O6H91_03G020400 [Diphasiastrum complanatum]
MACTSEVDEDSLYEDLYEDLGGGKQLLKTSIQEMEERLEHLTKGEKELQARLELMQKQVESTELEKNVLIRNISCLFKTAQLEVARKDKQIQKLQAEVLLLKSQISHSVNGKAKTSQASVFLEKQHKKDNREISTHSIQLQEIHNHNDMRLPAQRDKRDRRDSFDRRQIAHSRNGQPKVAWASVFTEQQQQDSDSGPKEHAIQLQDNHKDRRLPEERSKKDQRDSLHRRNERDQIDSRRCKAKYDYSFDGHFNPNTHVAQHTVLLRSTRQRHSDNVLE